MNNRKTVKVDFRETPGKRANEDEEFLSSGLPLLLALPFLAAVLFAAFRFGPKLIQLINVALKAAVVS